MEQMHPDKNRGLHSAQGEDVLFRRVCEHVERTGRCSVSDIQLNFRIGFKTAFRMVDRMIENGVVPVPPDQLN